MPPDQSSEPATKPDSQLPASSPPQRSVMSLDQLEAAFRSLRNLVNVVSVALIALTASLFFFVRHELKLARIQLGEGARHVAEYKSKIEPRINELHSKLEAYSKVHPDFTPILVKYFGLTNIPPS